MKSLITTTVAACVLCAPLPAMAGEGEEQSPWSGSLGLAYLATSGNTDTSSLGLDFKMERRPDPWGIELFANLERADQDGEKTAERYLAGVRGVRELSERWHLFTGLTGERDHFAGFDLEMVLESGATFKALLGPKHALAFDMGVTWTDVDPLEPEQGYDSLGAVLGAAYKWALSDNAAFTQGLMCYPSFDESSDWRATSETGIEANIRSRIAIKLSFGVRYRHEPIGDRDDTDTTTKASLVFKL